MIHYQKNGLTVFQSALWQTTSTVVEEDEFVLIVDPSWLPHEINAIQEHVEELNRNKEVYLLFTHGDFDHIIGYSAFLNAKVIASEGVSNHPAKDYKLGLIKDFDRKYYIDRPYQPKFPVVDIEINKDGQQLALGSTTLTFYLSPGHTHDGIFTIIEPQGIWIAGDYLSDFELPFVFDSVKAYQSTLLKAITILDKHHPSVLVPGHGKTTESKEEMKQRIEASQTYLSRLIEAVENEDEQTLSRLKQEMPYESSFTTSCHEENVQQVKREFANVWGKQ